MVFTLPPRPTFPHTTCTLPWFPLSFVHDRAPTRLRRLEATFAFRGPARWTIWIAFSASGASRLSVFSKPHDIFGGVLPQLLDKWLSLQGPDYHFCSGNSHGVARPCSQDNRWATDPPLLSLRLVRTQPPLPRNTVLLDVKNIGSESMLTV